jgi:hypothetical protein
VRLSKSIEDMTETERRSICVFLLGETRKESICTREIDCHMRGTKYCLKAEMEAKK